MESSLLFACAGIGFIVVITSILKAVKEGQRKRLPPGPKGLPFVGNLKDLPKPGVFEAHHWLKHKSQYGPISSVNVLGQTIIIINDARVAIELLEKRSAKHSSRPRQVFAGEMMGWENAVGLCPYNDHFRIYRKNMSRIIGSNAAAAQYNSLQEKEVGHFLLHVLNDPDSLTENIRREAGSVILQIVYGYKAEQFKNDVFIDMAGDAMDKFARAVIPGAYIVDLIPFLRYLPDWLPGTGFKAVARKWGAELSSVTNKPYAFVKHQRAQGKDDSSFVSRLLDAADMTPEKDYTNKWSAMALYMGGADTTVSSIGCFFLAMILFPEVQKKAQEEIDRIIGSDRLPTFSDRRDLPYVEAVVKEVLRWRPVGPMGLPHTSTVDDEYDGYFIPKGSMFLANIWHFTHDPEVYEDPMAFMPERFLENKHGKVAPDPHSFVFGFGRRICPGRILADNALYLTIVQSLAVFKIQPKMESGEKIQADLQFTSGVVSHPPPFKAEITARSAHHEELIRSIEKIFPWQEGDGDVLETITNHHFADCIIPILYHNVPSYESGIDEVPRGSLACRSLIVTWAAKHGYTNTLKNVIAHENIGPFISRRVPRNGRVATLGALGMTPLHQAALHGHVDFIGMLVAECGANVNAALGGFLLPIHLARDERVVRCLVSLGSSVHGAGRAISPLTYAISVNADTSAIKCLLELGNDPNHLSATSVSPGGMAVKRGNLAVLELLLEAGLDVSEPAPRAGSLIFQAICEFQETEPHTALAAVRLLLKHGAPAQGGMTMACSIYSTAKLWTNLHSSASRLNCFKIMKLLLEHGAQPDASSPEIEVREIMGSEPAGFNSPPCSEMFMGRLRLCRPSWRYVVGDEEWRGAYDELETPLLRLLLHDTPKWLTESAVQDRVWSVYELARCGSKIPQSSRHRKLLERLLFLSLGKPGWDDAMVFALDYGLNPFGKEAGNGFALIRMLLLGGWVTEDSDSSGMQRVIGRMLELGLDPNRQGNGDKITPLEEMCNLVTKVQDIIGIMASYNGHPNKLLVQNEGCCGKPAPRSLVDLRREGESSQSSPMQTAGRTLHDGIKVEPRNHPKNEIIQGAILQEGSIFSSKIKQAGDAEYHAGNRCTGLSTQLSVKQNTSNFSGEVEQGRNSKVFEGNIIEGDAPARKA